MSSRPHTILDKITDKEYTQLYNALSRALSELTGESFCEARYRDVDGRMRDSEGNVISGNEIVYRGPEGYFERNVFLFKKHGW